MPANHGEDSYIIILKEHVTFLDTDAPSYIGVTYTHKIFSVRIDQKNGPDPARQKTGSEK